MEKQALSSIFPAFLRPQDVLSLSGAGHLLTRLYTCLLMFKSLLNSYFIHAFA